MVQIELCKSFFTICAIAYPVNVSIIWAHYTKALTQINVDPKWIASTQNIVHLDLYLCCILRFKLQH